MKQPADWTRTPEGDAKYRKAHAEAQRRADASGCDVGLERNDLMKEFHVFGLPRRENRYGHELRCEVAHCSDPDKTQPGHGYAPRGPRYGAIRARLRGIRSATRGHYASTACQLGMMDVQ